MRNKLTFAVVVAMLSISSFAAAPAKEAKWSDNFTAAKSVAKKENRPILANFTGSDWCVWCIKMENDVFSQKEFLDFAADNLVLFIADFPEQKQQSASVTKQNKALNEKYKIPGYPTVLLLDAEGNVLGQTGYQPGGAESFVANLKELLEKAGVKAPAKPTDKAVAPSAK